VTTVATATRARKARPSGPQPYDFRRPNSLSREHIRLLQIAYETFARGCGTVFTTRLRAVSQVTLSAVEQLSYDEYVRSLSVPSLLALLSAEPLTGSGILALDHGMAMRCVDHLLGGTGAREQPERGFTEIEEGLLRGLAQRLLQELPYAFEAVAALRPEVFALELNAQFAQVAAPSDVMVVATFEVRVGETESQATLTLPLAPLLPMLDAALAKGRRSRDGDDAGDQARLRAGLAEVPVEVSVHFTPVRVASRVILDLAVGDVLPLSHPITAPLALSADTVVCARGVPGAQGKRLACLIVDPTTTASALTTRTTAGSTS
jgi:flagellar motor switch protein FliM